MSPASAILSESPAALRARIFAIFAVHAATAGALVVRLPDIQLRLGLSETALGALLTAGGAGALAVYAVSGKAVARFGTARVTLWGLIGANLAAALMVTMPLLPLAFLFSFLQAGAFTLANIAVNVEADRIEAATGRRVMNTCHGIWSLATLAVSLIAAGLRAAGLDVALHLWVHGAVVSVVLVVVVAGMRPQPPREAGGGGPGRFAWPTLATLGIVAFGIGGDLLHNAARSWSIIFLRDTFDVSRLTESMALPAFVLAMTATRLRADRWLDRYSPVRVGRVHLLLCGLGVALLAASPTPALALAGLGLIGAGSGPIFPMMVSAAARLGDRPAADNVAAVTLVIQLITLVVPLLVGVIAETVSLRLAFALFLPLLAGGFVAAGRLGRPGW